MNKQGKGIYFIVWGVILCLLVLYRILGVQGKTVLLGGAAFGIAILIIGGMAVWGGYSKSSARARTMALIIGIFLLICGIFIEVRVIRDFGRGTVITKMSDCYITSRSGIHGIVGFHYYLNGVDDLGNRLQFPLTFASKDRIEGMSSVTVEYYESIGRIVNLY